MSSYVLKAIGYNWYVKNMMHTTKMTANGCETIERKRMTGKMDHVIGWKLPNRSEKPLKSPNKRQNKLRTSDPIGYLTAREPSGKEEKLATIFWVKGACYIYWSTSSLDGGAAIIGLHFFQRSQFESAKSLTKFQWTYNLFLRKGMILKTYRLEKKKKHHSYHIDVC